MPGSVIVAGARTPIGKLSGALASFSAMDLGGFAIKAALERAGVRPDEVDYVFMGQVLQAGQGQITARQAAVQAGIPMTVPCTTVAPRPHSSWRISRAGDSRVSWMPGLYASPTSRTRAQATPVLRRSSSSPPLRPMWSIG